MRLTAEVIGAAPQGLNAVRDRELVLRGLKLPRIENLAVAKDQYSSIDLTDNELRRLENFPPSPHLQTLLLANNRISKIDNDVTKYIPNLEALVLSSNQLSELGDLDPLSGFKSLKYLCLMDNPVASRKHYRAYVMVKCPSVRILDFKRIKQKERAASNKLFAGVVGKDLLSTLSAQKAKAFDAAEGAVGPGGAVAEKEKRETAWKAPTPAETQQIRAALGSAKTLEDMRRIETQLRRGQVPEGPAVVPLAKGAALGGDIEEVEMEEDD